MTKTEYREYIAGEEWRRRRNQYLRWSGEACNRCHAPRRLVVLVYDQDLHVHHKSYARVGAELNKDLEALCRRCHELETFGTSELRKLEPACVCSECKALVWDYAERTYVSLCDRCALLLDGLSPVMLEANDLRHGTHLWKFILKDIMWLFSLEDFNAAVKLIADHYEHDPDGPLFSGLRDIPSRPGFYQRTFEQFLRSAAVSTNGPETHGE